MQRAAPSSSGHRLSFATGDGRRATGDGVGDDDGVRTPAELPEGFEW
jgi:hypothetical protein